ncbi:MAG TPA: hypothetical protein DDW67_04760, partial [Elusimicrobia bacterium]|nr:hypothetical protein [Elusimicrobiota bacterium]
MTILAAIIALLLPAAPAAAKSGVEAMPFLKLDAGPRPASMGGAYCASGDDAVAVFYNPASAGLVGRHEAYLGHNEWLEGMRVESGSYVHPHGYRLTFFGSLNALFSGAMRKYDALGTRLEDFDAREYALAGGAAYYLGAGFHFGAAVKLLNQSVGGSGGAGWAGDAGLLKKWDRWTAGASVSNFGGKISVGSESFEVPLILRAGAAFRPLDKVTIAGEGVKNGEAGFEGALGGELALPSGAGQVFFIRAGLRSGRDENTGPGVSAGLGMRTGPLGLDYSFSPYGDLGGAHRLSLSFLFGARRPPDLAKKPYAPARDARPYWSEEKPAPRSPSSRPADRPAS